MCSDSARLCRTEAVVRPWVGTRPDSNMDTANAPSRSHRLQPPSVLTNFDRRAAITKFLRQVSLPMSRQTMQPPSPSSSRQLWTHGRNEKGDLRKESLLLYIRPDGPNHSAARCWLILSFGRSQEFPLQKGMPLWTQISMAFSLESQITPFVSQHKGWFHKRKFLLFPCAKSAAQYHLISWAL